MSNSLPPGVREEPESHPENQVSRGPNLAGNVELLGDAVHLIGRYLDATVVDAAVCPACNRRTYEAAADYYERQSLTAVISKLRKIIDRRKSGA